MIDERKIKQLLMIHKIEFVENSTIWGKVTPSLGAYNNGMGEMMHIRREHILHFNNDGIAIIAVDDNTGQLLEETILFIANPIINSISIKLRLNGVSITIHTINGDITYKVPKKTISFKSQKENLSFLLLRST